MTINHLRYVITGMALLIATTSIIPPWRIYPKETYDKLGLSPDTATPSRMTKLVERYADPKQGAGKENLLTSGSLAIDQYFNRTPSTSRRHQ